MQHCWPELQIDEPLVAALQYSLGKVSFFLLRCLAVVLRWVSSQLPTQSFRVELPLTEDTWSRSWPLAYSHNHLRTRRHNYHTIVRSAWLHIHKTLSFLSESGWLFSRSCSSDSLNAGGGGEGGGGRAYFTFELQIIFPGSLLSSLLLLFRKINGSELWKLCSVQRLMLSVHWWVCSYYVFNFLEELGGFRGAHLRYQAVPVSPVEMLWAIIETVRKERAHLMKITTPHHQNLESILMTLQLVSDIYFH